jgi:hypothetical protein
MTASLAISLQAKDDANKLSAVSQEGSRGNEQIAPNSSPEMNPIRIRQEKQDLELGDSARLLRLRIFSLAKGRDAQPRNLAHFHRF